MTFALDNDPDNCEISDAINYLLANLPVGLSQNIANGQITNSSGIVVSYLYQYIHVKYATSFNGAIGFSNVPTGATYYGILNSNISSPEDTKYSDYTWSAGAFGTTNYLYYITTGGRQIQFTIAAIPPSSNWAIDPLTSINLDLITSSVKNSAGGMIMIGMDGEDGIDGVPGPMGLPGVQGNYGVPVYLESETADPEIYFMPGQSGNLGGYLVSTLPIAGLAGRRAHVTNALAPSFGVAVVGGGTVVIPVFDNGTTWIVG